MQRLESYLLLHSLARAKRAFLVFRESGSKGRDPQVNLTRGFSLQPELQSPARQTLPLTGILNLWKAALCSTKQIFTSVVEIVVVWYQNWV